MSSKKEDFEAEQKGVYAALCRAALKAKQEAERNGTPYVVADGKDYVAGKHELNSPVTLRDVVQK
jgi:hypothetical protein